MKNYIMIVILSILFTTSAYAEIETEYKDHWGRQINRWVLIDSNKQLHTNKLIVIEKIADGKTDYQRVIYKKYFSQQDELQFLKTKKYYETLQDLQSISAQEYFIYPERTDVPIWPITHNWTWDDEVDYSTWFEKNVSLDFFKNSGVVFDCADLAMALRWVYAHDHGLPAANTLAGSEKLFGNWSGFDSWNSLPTNSDWRKDERFKTALMYVLSNAYTHSLLGDLYPVEINNTYVRVSTIFLYLYDTTGHTQNIASISNEGIVAFWGNEPASSTIFKSGLDFMPLDQKNGGFLRFRWPENSNGTWKLKSPSQMPGYSTEYYSWINMSTSTLRSLVFERLGLLMTPINKVLAEAEGLYALLQYRLKITELGLIYCHLTNCSQNPSLYDEYSTPSRDSRLRRTYAQFKELLNAVDINDPQIQYFITKHNDPLVYGFPKTYSDYIFNKDNILEEISSDPTVDFFKRWGVRPTTDELALTTYSNFKYLWNTREDLISEAQDLCYPEDQGHIECNPNSASVKALNTDVLDNGLRTLNSQILNLMTLVTDPTIAKINNSAHVSYTDYFQCDWNSHAACSLHDYLFTDHGLMSKISPKAIDPKQKRYGF